MRYQNKVKECMWNNSEEDKNFWINTRMILKIFINNNKNKNSKIK